MNWAALSSWDAFVSKIGEMPLHLLLTGGVLTVLFLVFAVVFLLPGLLLRWCAARACLCGCFCFMHHVSDVLVHPVYCMSCCIVIACSPVARYHT